MDTSTEKRKHKRIRQNFIIKVKPRSCNEEASPSPWESVNAQDIGGGGILFYYHRNLPLGTFLDFEICFIPYKSKINCIGRIIRVDKPPASVITRIAAQFTEINEKDRKIIDKAAAKFKKI